MIIYSENHTKIRADKCKKPKFSFHKGRTWDWGNLTLDDKEINYVYDTTWGFYWYFNYENNWYKVNIIEQYEPHYGMKFYTYKA